MSKRFPKWFAGVALCVLLAAPAAWAAGFFTNGVPVAGSSSFPTTLPLTGNETIPADTNLAGGASPQSEAITLNQIAAFAQGFSGTSGFVNALTGGDFGVNLFQRGTTSASITTTLTYGPDRWWGLSGTSTAFTIIKETGATDIFPGTLATARVQRTSGQTGVVATCVGQVLTSADSTRFQGQTAEFSFTADSGANFSAASGLVTATIGYSVAGAADQTAANFSTTSWTGQVNVSQNVNLTSSFARYSVVAPIPATATQLGLKLCFTPVGTAGTNDWLEFSNAQLDVNPTAVALTGVAATAGSALAFETRPAAIEALLQYRYFEQINEPAANIPVGTCQATGATAGICVIPLPMPMRAAPVFTVTTGTFKVNIAGTQTTWVTPTAATGGAVNNICTATIGNTNTAGQMLILSGGGGSGVIGCSAEL